MWSGADNPSVGGIIMRGLITTRHLVTNAPTIIHEFGILAYFRCVKAVITQRQVTFLDCVTRYGSCKRGSKANTDTKAIH